MDNMLYDKRVVVERERTRSGREDRHQGAGAIVRDPVRGQGMTAPDFWGTLASRMPRQLDYASLCEWFAWDLPSDYNIGVDACDRHAADKGKLAIIQREEARP
jgi:hypothetical protein